MMDRSQGITNLEKGLLASRAFITPKKEYGFLIARGYIGTKPDDNEVKSHPPGSDYLPLKRLSIKTIRSAAPGHLPLLCFSS